jgi:sec-independent protein translocase protein TatA
MPFSIGPLESIIVLLIVFAVFGAKRVPELARSVGRGIHEVRSGLSFEEKKDKAAEGQQLPPAGVSSTSNTERE